MGGDGWEGDGREVVVYDHDKQQPTSNIVGQTLHLGLVGPSDILEGEVALLAAEGIAVVVTSIRVADDAANRYRFAAALSVAVADAVVDWACGQASQADGLAACERVSRGNRVPVGSRQTMRGPGGRNRPEKTEGALRPHTEVGSLRGKGVRDLRLRGPFRTHAQAPRAK